MQNQPFKSPTFRPTQSDNYVAGKSGWRLHANGVLETYDPAKGLPQLFDKKGALRVRLGIWEGVQ